MAFQRFTPRLRSALALGATALFLASCSLTLNIDGSFLNQTDDSSPSSSDYSMNELMFAQMMIPHHDQAVDMAQLALENSTNDDVRDLAFRIIAGQEPEIRIMESWLGDTDTRDTGPMGDHGGHGNMGGMASEDDLAELAGLASPDFDALFLALMIDHHEGALDMVRMISRSTHPEVRQLAQDIIRVQREEIDEMTDLQGDIRVS